MSRLDRLKEYSKPLHGPQGAGRDEKNLDYWANRAETNSDGDAHRGNAGPEVSLPATGKRQESRPTAMAPKESRKVNSAMIDQHMAGQDDLNHVGGSYMKSIRREA